MRSWAANNFVQSIPRNLFPFTRTISKYVLLRIKLPDADLTLSFDMNYINCMVLNLYNLEKRILINNWEHRKK